MQAVIDQQELEAKVKDMYRRVADEPHGDFHFEMGRALAERLGYDRTELDRVPQAAVDSFAGVGCPFLLADLRRGEQVLDLGSGSGMDTFVAALQVGDDGHVVGIDMTDKQLTKARRLAHEGEFSNVKYVAGHIEELPFEDAMFDVVLSNGVVNLSAGKDDVFREAARVLRPGGRLVLSDIVTDAQLPENIVCNTNLWAACIGGAMQRDAYRDSIESAGLQVESVRDNPQYAFLSRSAQNASGQYGVKSVTVLARKAGS